jgi:uncharacterized protein (TIGR02099 family)
MLQFPNFQSISSHRALNIFWIISSVFFWLCLAFWTLLLGFGLALHLLIAPNIDRFRVDIENSISAKIGTSIKIGEIRAISNSLFPSFEILDLATFNAAGVPMMHINRAWVSLSTQSILRLALDKLYVEDSEVTLKRLADGTLEFAGITLQDNSSTDLSDHFFSIRDISVTNTRVTWIDEKNKNLALKVNDVNLIIQNGLIDHQFRLDASPPTFTSDRVSLRAQFRQPLLSLHPGQWSQWTGQSYFQSERFDLAEVLTLFDLQSKFEISKGSGWVRAWVDFQNGKTTNQLFDFHFENIQTAFFNPGLPFNISSISGRLKTAPWLTGQEWLTEHLTMSFLGRNESWDFSNYRLAISDLTDPFGPQSKGEIEIRNANLENLSKFFKNFPASLQINKILTSLSIKGNVEHLNGVWGSSNPQDPSNVLNSPLPKWLENSKKLLNPFSNRNRQTDSSSSSSPPIHFEADNPFRRIKHFRFKGVVANFERNPSLSSLSFSESSQASNNFKIKSTDSSIQHPLSDYFSNIPHFKGLKGSFSFSESSGTAKLEINNGYLELAGALEQAYVDISQFSSHLDWTLSDNKLHLNVSNGRLVNQNGDMNFSFDWNHPKLSQFSPSYLGLLDLNAKISRLDAKTLYKYLPLSVNPSVRTYLKESIVSGLIDKGTIKIKGPIESIPYKHPSQGDFNIDARLNRIHLNYVPKTIFKSSALSLNDWPALSDIQGALQIKGRSLSINSPISTMGSDDYSVPWNRLEAKIPDLFDPVLDISGESKGLGSNYLYLFNHSSLNAKLGNPLERAKSKGNMELKLKLSLPLLEIDKTRVFGTLSFLNNDLFISSDIPTLSKTRGNLSFTESSMSFQNVQTHTLGGDTKIEGGIKMSSPGQDNLLQIKALGNVTSDGLEQSCDIEWASKLGSLSRGQTNYTALFSIKKTGVPEVSISSNLQGLSLTGPSPFNKSTDSSLPFSYENSVLKELPNNRFLEKISLALGDQVSMRLFKDTGPTQSNILAGSFTVGPNASSNSNAILPPVNLATSRNSNNGWSLSAVLPDLKLDEWQASVNKLLPSTHTPSCNTAFSDALTSNSIATPNAAPSYLFSLPKNLTLLSNKINSQGRDFHAVNISATREGNNWQANVQSKEVNGTVQLLLDTDPKSRRISAKLNELIINPIKNKINDPLMSEEEPFFPWFDVVIDHLLIKDRALGHVEFEAHNQLTSKGKRFWQLNNIQLTNPDVVLKATAKWASLTEPNQIGTQSNIDLSLDILNSGNLLSRLGTPGAVREGKGNLKGQLTWKGSLINPDFDSLNGHFSLDVEKGQFLKTDPGASRLLGVLNLQALPRRLTLDFRDLFGEGFAFDQFKGDIAVKDGTASSENLIMKGVSGTVLLNGSANIGAETQDLRVVVVPEINAGTASLLYSTVNPIVGLTSFIAQYVIRKPLIQANTRTFHINGSWNEPNVTRIETPIEELR